MQIEEIIKVAQRKGSHFFDKGNMKFFRSKVSSTVYEGPGGIFFITSEQFVSSMGNVKPRQYTIRKFDLETGDIITVEGFNCHDRREANERAKKLSNLLRSL